MRLEQLEYLATVARCGSLRRAGDELHVSQSALSEAISKLERELGLPLLERRQSGATVSDAGRELLHPIIEVLDAVDRVRSAARQEAATRRPLRLGTVNAGTASLLLPAVRAFQAQHPGATVEIRNLMQREIESGLAEGSLDLGLVNLLGGDDVPPTLAATALVAGRPVAVLPADHALALTPEVSADDLRAERFVAMRSGYVMSRFAHRLFGQRPPSDWHEADGAEMGKMMVASGMGITLLPDYSVLDDPLERAGVIVTRPVAGDATVVTMVALHRRQARVPVAVTDLLGHFTRRAAGPMVARSA